MHAQDQIIINTANRLLASTPAAAVYLPLSDGKALYMGSPADIASMLPDQSGAAVRGEAVAAARAVLEEKWDAEGACESCGWHASLGEHHVDDEDIAEAMLFGCKLKLSCLSKDDDTRDSHRGVTIDISARAADAPSETSEKLYFVRMTKTDGWREASEAAYWTFSEVNRRILYESRAADALDSQPTGLPVLYATHVENIELALAQELDDAALSANDYVTVNREKLRGIAERILAAAKLELSSQPTEPWTRTEDRLPPVETPVLILHSGDVKIGEIRWENPSHEETFEAFMYWDDPNDDGQSWDWLEVTHWMPIPPAPASSQPTDGGVRNGCDLKSVHAFLMGESPLEGVQFGDRHPTKAGAHWWRLNLRAALAKG